MSLSAATVIRATSVLPLEGKVDRGTAARRMGRLLNACRVRAGIPPHQSPLRGDSFPLRGSTAPGHQIVGAS
jgi:hypothetical protein